MGGGGGGESEWCEELSYKDFPARGSYLKIQCLVGPSYNGDMAVSIYHSLHAGILSFQMSTTQYVTPRAEEIRDSLVCQLVSLAQHK